MFSSHRSDCILYCSDSWALWFPLEGLIYVKWLPWGFLEHRKPLLLVLPEHDQRGVELLPVTHIHVDLRLTPSISAHLELTVRGQETKLEKWQRQRPERIDTSTLSTCLYITASKDTLHCYLCLTSWHRLATVFIWNSL